MLMKIEKYLALFTGVHWLSTTRNVFGKLLSSIGQKMRSLWTHNKHAAPQKLVCQNEIWQGYGMEIDWWIHRAIICRPQNFLFEIPSPPEKKTSTGPQNIAVGYKKTGQDAERQWNRSCNCYWTLRQSRAGPTLRFTESADDLPYCRMCVPDWLKTLKCSINPVQDCSRTKTRKKQTLGRYQSAGCKSSSLRTIQRPQIA